MKIRRFGAWLFHAEGHTDRQTCSRCSEFCKKRLKEVKK